MPLYQPLSGGTAVTVDADGTLVVDETTVELATDAALGTAAALDVGTTTGTVAAGDDARLTNARTPTAHAASHGSGQPDAVTVAQSQVTGLTDALGGKAPLASPTFTGTPAAPPPAAGTRTTQIATTAFVTAQTDAALWMMGVR